VDGELAVTGRVERGGGRAVPRERGGDRSRCSGRGALEEKGRRLAAEIHAGFKTEDRTPGCLATLFRLAGGMVLFIVAGFGVPILVATAALALLAGVLAMFRSLG
jgi:hypothetical protein